MSKWLPDRKIVAGGIASIVAFLIATAFNISYDVVAPAVIGVYGLVAYLVPASVRDVVSKIDDSILALAQEKRAGQ